MNQLIVGFSGRKGSGKTYIARELEKTGFERISFADPIKIMLFALFDECGFDYASAKWLLNQEKEIVLEAFGKSPRQLMQSLGTDWGRAMVSENLWLLCARNKIEKNHSCNIVIDDVRFNNEAQFIRDLGGLIINIDRAADTRFDAHVSEEGIIIKPGDVMLTNDGTILELLNDVIYFIESFKNKNQP